MNQHQADLIERFLTNVSEGQYRYEAQLVRDELSRLRGEAERLREAFEQSMRLYRRLLIERDPNTKDIRIPQTQEEWDRLPDVLDEWARRQALTQPPSLESKENP